VTFYCFKKPVKKIHVSLKSDKKKVKFIGTHTHSLIYIYIYIYIHTHIRTYIYTFMTVTRSFMLRKSYVLEKVIEKIKTLVLRSILFPENRAFYDIKWKNMV
jgi:hypothetical protein